MIAMKMLDRRRQSVLEYSSKMGVEALVSFEPENIFYLTGFWGEGITVCLPDKTLLVVPSLEASRAEILSGGSCQIVRSERGSDMISSALSALSENDSICTDCNEYETVSQIMKKRKIGSVMVNNEPFYASRKIKDSTELQIISDASAILDRLFEICIDKIRAGISERSLQADLMYQALMMGANPPSYRWTLDPLIIASGPNGALPHAGVTDRCILDGDFVVVDLTLRHRGYIADATRTFAVRNVTAEMEKVYNIVAHSQKAGLDAATEGVSCDKVDSVCRELISEAGYGDRFIHSTGHGIGLEVHEMPWIRSKNSDILKKGMTVTIEPGIYFENIFGVRIEDSVAITEDKVVTLNKFTKDLVYVG